MRRLAIIAADDVPVLHSWQILCDLLSQRAPPGDHALGDGDIFSSLVLLYKKDFLLPMKSGVSGRAGEWLDNDVVNRGRIVRSQTLLGAKIVRTFQLSHRSKT